MRNEALLSFFRICLFNIGEKFCGEKNKLLTLQSQRRAAVSKI